MSLIAILGPARRCDWPRPHTSVAVADTERRGFAGTVNGPNLATAGLAAICATPFVPRMIHRFGTALPVCMSDMVGHRPDVPYEVPSLWLWFPARFVLSCGLNSLFVISV
jgi:hypothetical protein